MKRDMDMVRDILIGLGEGKGRTNFEFNTSFESIKSEEKSNDELIYYHYQILRQAGLIDFKESRHKSGVFLINIPQLTWNGNEYLSSIESDTVWIKTKSFIKEKGLEVSKLTFDVIMAVAKAEAKKRLGLDPSV